MEVRITKVRVAMAALLVLAGVGLASLLSPLVGDALATVGSTVNISDNSAAANFAKVDATGKLAVGDGAGPLGVDGTVASRPAAPASPWRFSSGIQPGTFIAGPSALPINVTSLSVSSIESMDDTGVTLDAYHVPSSATNCLSNFMYDGTIWEIYDAGDGVTPVSFTFPTPLQYKPPSGRKACLWAGTTGLAQPQPPQFNAVGFYGG